MEPIKVACIQQRMKLAETPEDFASEARRFLYQAQSKAAQLVIFPELCGLMLSPPLISGAKRGLIQRESRGKQPGAGLFSQSLGRLAGSTAGAMGGGFRGSLGRMVRKNSEAFSRIYVETFGALAREYKTTILAGSLYQYDSETDSVRHRTYLFDVDGEVLGYSEKLNLAYAEQDLASPGTELMALDTRFGRVGVLIGQDVMYPELARLLAIQGADLLIGIAAAPGPAAGRMLRSALALRAEENQAYAAASFLVGPNLLGRENLEDYHGQAALMAPISLTVHGDGLLLQAGTDRTEGIIAADLDMDALYDLRQTSRFQPRREMNLGSLGPVLAQVYDQGLTVEEALAQRIAGPAEPILEPPEEMLEELPEPVETVPLEPLPPPAGEAPEEEAAQGEEPQAETEEAEPLPQPDSKAGAEPESRAEPEQAQEPASSQGQASRPGTETASVPEAMSITRFRKVK